jgi:hypothetical protein
MKFLSAVLLGLFPLSALAQVGHIPEPETLLLLGLGAAVLLAVRGKRK